MSVEGKAGAIISLGNTAILPLPVNSDAHKPGRQPLYQPNRFDW
jgi:hypothetical protein